MKLNNEELSAIVDDEAVNEALIDQLIIDQKEQATFSRYHLIGEAIRNDADAPFIHLDISQQVMDGISSEQEFKNVENVDFLVKNEKNNVISLVKRFGQYAIAASVAGIVVVATTVNSPQTESTKSSPIEVLNTVPFGGSASPVSLEASKKQSEEFLKERYDRFDALLKDHQLQLQTQP